MQYSQIRPIENSIQCKQKKYIFAIFWPSYLIENVGLLYSVNLTYINVECINRDNYESDITSSNSENYVDNINLI